MLITQKYNSANDIDPEFIPALEELLAEHVPCFQVIKNYEKVAKENINFTYYLFFGPSTNTPIGYAQAEIEIKPDREPSFFQKIFNKKSPINSGISKLSWTSPGVYREGIIFSPQFIRYAGDKTSLILNEYFKREDVREQKIRFSESLSLANCFKDLKAKTTPSTSLGFLLKNKNSYQEFIEDLSFDLKKNIQADWKFIMKNLGLELKEYKSFKEVFQYKSDGASQYKELKRSPKVIDLAYIENECEFLTLESTNRVEAIVSFSIGKGKNAFYDILLVGDNIPENIPLQMALMKFFENDDLHKLHSLVPVTDPKEHLAMGFCERRQNTLSISKEVK